MTYKKAHHNEDGLIDANNRINAATIRDLPPDTLCQYQIITTEILDFQPYEVKFGETVKSPVYKFKTPKVNEETVKWVVMNDILDRPKSVIQLLYQLGSKGNDKDYDFVVFNGYAFSFVESEQQIVDHLLTPCGNVFAPRIGIRPSGKNEYLSCSGWIHRTGSIGSQGYPKGKP